IALTQAFSRSDQAKEFYLPRVLPVSQSRTKLKGLPLKTSCLRAAQELHLKSQSRRSKWRPLAPSSRCWISSVFSPKQDPSSLSEEASPQGCLWLSSLRG